jgi:transcription elongation factor Elf1
MRRRIPKGFTCTKCGKRNEFRVYVVANRTTLFTHTCDCAARHHIYDGMVADAYSRKAAEVYYAI